MIIRTTLPDWISPGQLARRAFAVLCGSLLATISHGEDHAYNAEALPQNSDPAWELVGGNKLRTEVMDGILQVESVDSTWSEWRLGQDKNGTEFGASSALQLEPGGTITVDFRIRIPNADTPPQGPCMRLRVVNGRVDAAVAVSSGEIVLLRHQPIPFDTTQWADCRLVVEGGKIAFFLAQTGEERTEIASVDRNYGTFIAFGIPPGKAADAPRGFELKFVRWYPNQALYEPPEILEP